MVMFRIVLCDDSPADLMVLCGHLEQLKEKRPVDIISYTDGLDLLKDYKQKGFCDILVLDMRMKNHGRHRGGKAYPPAGRRGSHPHCDSHLDYAVRATRWAPSAIS